MPLTSLTSRFILPCWQNFPSSQKGWQGDAHERKWFYALGVWCLNLAGCYRLSQWHMEMCILHLYKLILGRSFLPLWDLSLLFLESTIFLSEHPCPANLGCTGSPASLPSHCGSLDSPMRNSLALSLRAGPFKNAALLHFLPWGSTHGTPSIS